MSKCYKMQYVCKSVKNVIETVESLNLEEIFSIIKKTGHDVDALSINVIYESKNEETLKSPEFWSKEKGYLAERERHSESFYRDSTREF